MKVTASYRGGDRPFEGDRTVVLQALPVGARISAARFSLAPADPPPGSAREKFVERFALGAVAGTGELVGTDLGVTNSTPDNALAGDFHARRTLAPVDGA